MPLLLQLFFASVTVNVGVKYLERKHGMDYLAVTHTCWITTSVVVVAIVMSMRFFGFAGGMLPITREQWQAFAPTALLLSIKTFALLHTWHYVNEATFLFSHGCFVGVVAVVDYRYFGNKLSILEVIFLVLIIANILLFSCFLGVMVNPMGLVLLLAYSIATILNIFWNKVVITRHIKELKVQNVAGTTLIQQIEMLPFAFFSFVLEDKPVRERIMAFALTDSKPVAVMLTLLLFLAGAVSRAFLYPKCYTKFSPSSIIVASVTNKAATILICMYLFDTQPTPVYATHSSLLKKCIISSLCFAVAGNIRYHRGRRLGGGTNF